MKRAMAWLVIGVWMPLTLQAAEEKLPAPSATPLFWKGDEQVAGFRNMSRLFPHRDIHAGGRVLELPVAERDLDGVTFADGDARMTVAQYIERQRVAGLLVVKDGTIVYERYALGNDRNTRWVSFSVSKSVVSMLIGAAIQDGYIRDVNESVTAYLPRLAHSSYDASSIENLLQMASGVAWNEDYADPDSDVATASYATLPLYEFLRNKPRDAKPGEKFNYNTAETNLAGTLLRSAIGNNLSTYLEEKIWQPFGMESDAFWQLTEPGGGEFGGCCINATLRDYARIGLFALADGVLADGTRVLPEGWMMRSTTPSRGFDGYGYFWWLKPDDAYAASGIFGQGIYINPGKKVVIALHSARPDASKDSDWILEDALFQALADAVAQ
ncbi:MAG: serine hydrolase [Pseudomonadales bacterium]|nr:serine hydrolase [Pseudomonadales bacterium]